MDNIKESSGILKFLYNTVLGRTVLKVITSPTISKIGGVYMDSKLSTIHIKGFIKNNNIDMSQYEKAKYKSFNDFFTRKILPGKRPVCRDEDVLISPCDGRLSAYHIDSDSCFYIKKSRYSIQDLLQGSKAGVDYNGGTCIILRLCVDDYHRYGNIDDGVILENRYIKGRLHTVRPIAVNRYPVFVQNSREYTIIKTKNFGRVAQIEVGALMIGKIKNHLKSGSVIKGTEKGMFLYGGSTIVLLFERNTVSIPEKYFEETENDREVIVKYGSKIGGRA